MKVITFLLALAIAAVLAWATARAQDADDGPGRVLPDDQPVTINGVEMACTGVGDEARDDPRWRDFSVRMEFAGGEAQYLSDLDIEVEGDGGDLRFDVRCNSPWLVANLPPGKYRLAARFENLTKTAKFTAPAQGQARVVVRFPEVVSNRD